MGASLDCLAPVEEPEKRRARLERVFADVKTFTDRDVRYVTRSGGQRALEVVAAAVFDPLSGRATALLRTIRDLTERRAAEERFRLLFQWSSEAHLLYDDTGIVDCNAATRSDVGCERESAFRGRQPAHSLVCSCWAMRATRSRRS